MVYIRLLLYVGLLADISLGVPQLLYANRKNICIIDVDGANSTVMIAGLEDAAAVDYVFHDDNTTSIYWTDVSQEAIKRITITGTSLSVSAQSAASVIISTGLMSPDGLACDWIGRKLYWTDSEINRIEVSNLDGRMRKVLFWEGLDQPRAIALYPQKGLMFWTDWGEVAKIERAGMDGDSSTRRVIVSSNIYWPNGLTIDYAPTSGPGQGRLYWADGKITYIQSCNLDGTGRIEVIGGQLPHPFALTLFDQSLYWTDWQTKAIYTCNKTSGSDRKMIVSNLYSPMDIRVYHWSRQPYSPNPCGSNNGGCSHLCLMSSTEPYYHCACPTGVRRLSDNRTCADGASQILLLVRRTDLRWVSLDTSDYTDVVLDIKDVRHAIAVDYDPVDKHIYWTDDESRSIRRAYLDGSGQEVIISTEIDRPDGVAVDWVARNIYWTDTGPDHIEVARLNGSSRRVLISDDLSEPRAIIVDPLGGRMYWSDWGSAAKIERANLDGSDRQTIVNTSLAWPNGLTIDYAEQRIYWGDAKLDRIEYCSLNGSRRQILTQSDLPHIFGLTILGDYLYWTDWIQREVGRVHKVTGQRTVILEQLPDLMGLKAVNVTSNNDENSCSRNNGGCSHLCLNRAPPLTHVCQCPATHELLPDGLTCIVPEAFLLYSRRIDIRRISLEATRNDAVIPLEGGVKSARALDFDISDNRIYWTDLVLKNINRAYMNGTAVEHIVVGGLESPESVVVDWIAHNLYWADSGTERIEMSQTDGSSRLVLIWNDIQPHAIAVDPAHGYLYWSNWLSPARLERSNLDGTGRRTFVSEVGRVNGITIDYELERLYWANIDSHVIESVSLSSGTDRQVIVTGLTQPFGLTQFRDFIYWTDFHTKSIERADKISGGNRSYIQNSNEIIMDVSIFHSSRQSGWNECGFNNGRCSHLCVAHANSTGSLIGYHCACPSHYSLDEDNHTCLPPEAFLLYSQRNSISRILLELNGSATFPDVLLPIQNLRAIRAVDFDPLDNYVYWIDRSAKSIRRARDNATNSSVFFLGQSHDGQDSNPYDLVVDPFSRTLYWSDSSRNVIRAARLDTANVGVVVNSGQPRYLAVAPEQGYLFWTNAAKVQKVERSSTDGTARVSLYVVNTIGPIAVDASTQRIFWANTELRRIESGDFEGGNRMALVDGGIGVLSSLSVYGPYLYWVDRNHGLVERVDKTNGHNRTRIHLGPAAVNITDMVIVRRLATRNPCSHNNGGCSHFCIPIKGNANKCTCPVGYVLGNDDKTCITPPTCSANEFTCKNGFCIPESWRCDGYKECEDDSDELDCTACSLPGLFLCRETGQCLHGRQQCDGTVDCPAGSDEENCVTCSNDQFKCQADQQCIDGTLACNLVDDCSDGADELDCANVTPDVDVASSRDVTTPYVIGIGLVGGVTFLVFVIFIFVCLCRHKSREQIILDDLNNIVMVAKASPPATIVLSDVQTGSVVSAVPPCPPPPPSSVSLGNKSQVSSGSILYDRDHITGASSSSSTTTTAAARLYPKETMNPPPSPVTERSRSVIGAERRTKNSGSGGGVRAAVKARLYRQRRKHRHKMQRLSSVTTPSCSTDMCEDSEPYLAVADNIGRDTGYSSYFMNENRYTFECDPLCPPPPTPYLSEEPSCPPSPRSTECSFFISYPPPPPSSDYSD